MSHDTHFLARLERLSPAQVEWALSLYRNVPLVRTIVEWLAPPDATRIALAVDDEPDGAHVLVERDGRFVTCLGPGMKHDLPIISRAAVEHSAKARELVPVLRDTAARKSSRQAFLDLVKRFFEGPRLAREHAAELRAWAPVFGGILDRAHLQELRTFTSTLGPLETPERFKRRHERLIRQQWLAGWTMGHLGPICAEGLRGLYLTPGNKFEGMRAHYVEAGWLPMLAGCSLRCCWAIADLAEATIDDLEAAWVNGYPEYRVYPAAWSLVLSGLRNPSLRERVGGILARDFVKNEPLDDEDRVYLAKLRDVFARPQEALLRDLESARAWATTALPGVVLDDRQVLAARLYDTTPLTTIDANEALIDMLPFAAASAYEDLYLPADVLARFPPEDLDADALAYQLALREAVKGVYEASGEEPPSNAPPPPPPGRNEPCHCGSGRKYKKCHGR